jgi:hypothetical protein
MKSEEIGDSITISWDGVLVWLHQNGNEVALGPKSVFKMIKYVHRIAQAKHERREPE